MTARRSKTAPRTYAELFGLDVIPPQPARPVERAPKAPTAQGWADCPCCSATGVALVPQGPHLAWRGHDVVTIRGTRTPCRASGVALCDLGARRRTIRRKPKPSDGPMHDRFGARIIVADACRCGERAPL